MSLDIQKPLTQSMAVAENFRFFQFSINDGQNFFQQKKSEAAATKSFVLPFVRSFIDIIRLDKRNEDSTTTCVHEYTVRLIDFN